MLGFTVKTVLLGLLTIQGTLASIGQVPKQPTRTGSSSSLGSTGSGTSPHILPVRYADVVRYFTQWENEQVWETFRFDCNFKTAWLPGHKKMNYKFKFYLKVLKFVSEHSFIWQIWKRSKFGRWENHWECGNGLQRSSHGNSRCRPEGKADPDRRHWRRLIYRYAFCSVIAIILGSHFLWMLFRELCWTQG